MHACVDGSFSHIIYTKSLGYSKSLRLESARHDHESFENAADARRLHDHIDASTKLSSHVINTSSTMRYPIALPCSCKLTGEKLIHFQIAYT